MAKSSSASSAVSSAASAASVSASVLSSSVGKSISSATAKASAAAQDASSKLSPTASSAASAVSATATKLAANAQQGLSGLSKFSIAVTAIVTVLAMVAAAIYFAGYADDVGRWAAQKYYAGKAQAEITAMGKVGSEKVEGMLKDSLKKNPIMGADELDEVVPGLGGEAVQEGLGGVNKKLGKFGEIIG